MKHEQSVEIDAPAEVVWSIVEDVERWSEWTPSIQRIQRLDPGPLRPGSRATVKQPRMPRVQWEVTRHQPGRSFSWQAKSPGLVSTGAHEVVALAPGRSKATLRITQEGALEPVARLLLGSMSRRYVALEAAGLKRHAEMAARVNQGR